MRRDISVGIATRYGLYGPGIESWGEGVSEIFCTRPDRPFGPPSPLYYWRRFSFIGVKYEGHGVERTPSSIAEVKEIVELYFFSPSGHVLR